MEQITAERDWWKRQHETVSRERAASFDRLSKAVGGVACTPWQPEVDLEIEGRIRALQHRASRLEDAAFHFQTCRTCRLRGEDACPDGAKFAAFLCGGAPSRGAE